MSAIDEQQTKQRSEKYTSKQDQQSKETVNPGDLENKANTESRPRHPGDRRHNPMISTESEKEAKDKLARVNASKTTAKKERGSSDK